MSDTVDSNFIILPGPDHMSAAQALGWIAFQKATQFAWQIDTILGLSRDWHFFDVFGGRSWVWGWYEADETKVSIDPPRRATDEVWYLGAARLQSILFVRAAGKPVHWVEDEPLRAAAQRYLDRLEANSASDWGALLEALKSDQSLLRAGDAKVKRATATLRRALWGGKVRASGREHESRRLVLVPAEAWIPGVRISHEGDANIHREGDWNDEDPQILYERLAFDTEDVLKLWPMPKGSEIRVIEQTPEASPSQLRRPTAGGRTLAHDWDAFWIEVAHFVAKAGVDPAYRSTLQKRMEDWAAGKKAPPDESTIRKKLAALYGQSSAPN